MEPKNAHDDINTEVKSDEFFDGRIRSISDCSDCSIISDTSLSPKNTSEFVFIQDEDDENEDFSQDGKSSLTIKNLTIATDTSESTTSLLNSRLLSILHPLKQPSSPQHLPPLHSPSHSSSNSLLRSDSGRGTMDTTNGHNLTMLCEDFFIVNNKTPPPLSPYTLAGKKQLSGGSATSSRGGSPSPRFSAARSLGSLTPKRGVAASDSYMSDSDSSGEDDEKVQQSSFSPSASRPSSGLLKRPLSTPRMSGLLSRFTDKSGNSTPLTTPSSANTSSGSIIVSEGEPEPPAATTSVINDTL